MNKHILMDRLLNRFEKSKSAWKRGVLQYAVELINDVDLTDVCNQKLLEKAILNGAENWKQYSEGGCALCYDGDICDRLCPPSVIKRKDNGRLPPNSRESWIDVQARALFQAARIIKQEAQGLFEIDS